MLGESDVPLAAVFLSVSQTFRKAHSSQIGVKSIFDAQGCDSGSGTQRPLGVMSAAVLLPNALSRGGNLCCRRLFGRCFEDYGSLACNIPQLNAIRSAVSNSSAMRMKRG